MVAPRPDPRPAGLGPTPPNTLIGFSCPACGYLLPARARPPGPAPRCGRLDSQNRQAARADPDAGPLHALSHPGPVWVGMSAEEAGPVRGPREPCASHHRGLHRGTPVPVADLIAGIQWVKRHPWAPRPVDSAPGRHADARGADL